MSDVREVTEWHEAMEGTLTVAGERLGDEMDDLIEASGIPKLAFRVVILADRFLRWITRSAD
ncbi:hypothetical protein [Microbacterium sp. H6]|uniref:hypothetical protein n=1 Tax=Microbacterium sp. H6 TaxID=421122 RepID=UPI0011BF4727|nr:hypothetical protein [Microbacterium sp. H6]